MQLVLDQVRKPVRELRKSLRDLPGNPPQRAVHNLRTRSRRIEAVVAALVPHQGRNTRRLLKSIKPLRKAAGEVRDMDVLLAKVRILMRHCHEPSFESLLAHIQSVRTESARELSKSFAAESKSIRHQLKKFSRLVEEEFSRGTKDARQAHALFDELRSWPKLSTQNLHEFRIKLKELRYMLQLFEGTDSAFLKALETAKVRIGSWHDLEQLHMIATKVLDLRKDRAAIEAIAEVEAKELRLAMRAAQLLRTRYLRTINLLETAEP